MSSNSLSLEELILHYEKMQAAGMMKPEIAAGTLSALRELELARIAIATKKAAKAAKKQAKERQA